MKKIKQIDQELADVSLLQELTSTFESIAAQNLANTRDKVLSSRAFLEEAQQIYTRTRQIYADQHKLAAKNLEYHQQLTIRPDNGKHLSIVVAPNTKLYGSLPDMLLNKVVEELRKEPRDVLVLGKVAVEHFERLKPPIPFTTFPIENEDYTAEQIQAIVMFVSQYHKVSAFHNQFRTILTNDVLDAPLNLTTAEPEAGGSSPEAEGNGNQSTSASSPQPPASAKPKGLAKYIAQEDALFEPSIEEVLNFFETVILKTLLRQKVRESLLARYAARMVAMDVATENAKEAKKRLHQELRRAKRVKSNQKMLDSYSGLSLWMK